MLDSLADAVDDLLALILQQLPRNPPQFTQMCLGPAIAEPRDLDRYIPTVRTAAAMFGRFDPEQRIQALEKWAIVVRQSRDRLIKALETTPGVRLDISVPARVRTVLRKFTYRGARLGRSDEDPSGPCVTDVGWLLREDETPIRRAGQDALQTSNAKRVVMSLVNPQPSEPPRDLIQAHTDTGEKAAGLLLELRCLDNVYNRFRVACFVSEKTKAPLPRVLALWRREGDLAYLPSMGSLKGEDVVVNGTRVELPPGRLTQIHHLDVSPQLSTTVAIAHKCRLINYLKRTERSRFDKPCAKPESYPSPSCLDAETDLSNIDLANRSTRTKVLELMNYIHHLALMGLDALISIEEKVRWRKKDGTPEGVLVETERVRSQVRGRGASANIANIKSRADDLLVEDGLHRLPGTPSDAWVVVPKDAFVYTSKVVEEGVYLLEWIMNERRFPFIDSEPLVLEGGRAFSEALGYSAYNLGPHNVVAFWASALAHARRRETPLGIALDDAVTQALKAKLAKREDFESMVRAVREADDEGVRRVGRAHWDEVTRPILQHGRVLERLEDYVMSATTDEWPSFVQVRRNVIAYENCRRFYDQLITQ